MFNQSYLTMPGFRSFVRFGLAALSCVWALTGCDSSPQVSGTPAPDFSVQSLDTPVRLLGLKDFKGKVLIVDFWATWCVPCRETMPVIYSAYHQYKDKGLDVVAITDERRSVVAQFRSMNKIDYPMYLDNNHDANRAFGVKSLPTMFVINKKGEVVYSEVGAPLDQYKLKDAIDASLK